MRVNSEKEFAFSPWGKAAPATAGLSSVAGQRQELVLSSAACTELVLGSKGFAFRSCQSDVSLEARNSISNN